MQEKRRFVRIEWPVIVEYKTLDEPHSQDQIIGKDISEGGVCFLVYERLSKGTELEMQIQVPFDSMPIFVKGRVVWIKRFGEEHESTFEIGVEFFGIEPNDEKRLRTYISNEIKERK